MSLDKFERPTSENVELGDFLVVEANRGTARVGLMKIKEVNKVYIHARDDESACSCNTSYRCAIVLKKDGTCLIGREVIAPRQ